MISADHDSINFLVDYSILIYLNYFIFVVVPIKFVISNKIINT